MTQGAKSFFPAIGSKFNSCHDNLGRFCSSRGGGSGASEPNVRPASTIREQSQGSYVRGLTARDLSTKLGKGGVYNSGVGNASFVTSKSPEEIGKALESEGFTKQGNNYYQISQNSGGGMKATITPVKVKPSFYAAEETHHQVELTSVFLND